MMPGCAQPGITLLTAKGCEKVLDPHNPNLNWLRSVNEEDIESCLHIVGRDPYPIDADRLGYTRYQYLHEQH